MAYGIVNGALFNPFSYAELLAPVLMADQEHKAIEESIGDLSAKASVWEGMASLARDPLAYSTYSTYAEDLENAAGDLARSGLTPSSRQNLLGLRRRYASEIAPIELAFSRRRLLADEFRLAGLKDPTLLSNLNPADLSLDLLIENPELSYNSYSGSLITLLVATAANNLAKELREEPRKWRGILGNLYYETLMKRGYDPLEILATIASDDSASPILNRLIEDAVLSSGVPLWGNEEATQRAIDYAKLGLWSAIGLDEYLILSNKAYDYAMQDWLSQQLDARRRQLELDKIAAKNKDATERTFARAVPTTRVDSEKKTTLLNSDMQFIEELYNNPELLNKKETKYREKYVHGDPQLSFAIPTGPGEAYEVEPNKAKLKSLLERYGVLSYPELYLAILADIASAAVRELSYKLNITDSSLVGLVLKENVRSISRRSGNTGLREIDGSKVSNKYISSDDISDIFDKDIDIELDPNFGVILNYTGKKGKLKSVLLDPEVFDTLDRAIATDLKQLEHALNIGNDLGANELINSIVTTLYMKFNTLAPKQGNTLSVDKITD